MNSHIGSGPGFYIPPVEENANALEALVSVISRSSGVVMLFAALVAITIQLVG